MKPNCPWCGRPCDETAAFHQFLQRHDLVPECYSDAPDEWLPFLDLLVTDLKDMGWSGKIAQIKSKFGHLCFYAEEVNDAMDVRIAQAAAQIRGLSRQFIS